MNEILGVLVAYLIGSVSFPGLYAKLRGIDLYKKGEGHLGATSIYTATGSAAAFLILGVLDAAKGLVAYRIFGVWGLVAAMLGHMFPVFFRFRGGNAVSVYYGGAFAVSPAIVLTAAVAEFLVSRILRNKLRHVLYLAIRSIPAILYPEILPAYFILLLRHAWFYYVRFRQGSS